VPRQPKVLTDADGARMVSLYEASLGMDRIGVERQVGPGWVRPVLVGPG